jgi:hypothetical protein
MSKQIIWNSRMIEEAAEKINNGFVLSRIENPFYENTIGLRKSGLTFRMSAAEIDEYVKCKMDVQYFAEKYCWVKGEKGEPVKLKLRDYQKEILDNFFNNRFNILMASRQTGKCSNFNTIIEIEKNGLKIYTRVGKLYYFMISQQRKLSILERIKIKIYDTIFLIEGKPSF